MTPEQQSTLTRLTIQGATTREIGQAIGLSHVAVSNARKKPDIKAQVEAGIQQLIRRGLKPAVNTLCRAAALGNTKSITLPDNRDLLKISVDASNRILSHVSGSGPQTVINQLIYSQGAHSELSPESQAMLNRMLSLDDSASGSDVIDIDPAVDNPVDNT